MKQQKKFKTLGAEIIDVDLPHTKYALPTYYVIAPAEQVQIQQDLMVLDMDTEVKIHKTQTNFYTNTRTEGFGDEVKRRIIIGTYVLSSGFYDAYFKKAQKVRRIIKQDLIELLKVQM